MVEYLEKQSLGFILAQSREDVEQGLLTLSLVSEALGSSLMLGSILRGLSPKVCAVCPNVPVACFLSLGKATVSHLYGERSEGPREKEPNTS